MHLFDNNNNNNNNNNFLLSADKEHSKRSNWNLVVLVFVEREKAENILSEPTTNSTQATLVGGERSHHCTTPPPYT